MSKKQKSTDTDGGVILNPTEAYDLYIDKNSTTSDEERLVATKPQQRARHLDATKRYDAGAIALGVAAVMGIATVIVLTILLETSAVDDANGDIKTAKYITFGLTIVCIILAVIVDCRTTNRYQRVKMSLKKKKALRKFKEAEKPRNVKEQPETVCAVLGNI